MLLDVVPILSILILNRINFREISDNNNIDKKILDNSVSNKTSLRSQRSDDIIRVRFMNNLEIITQHSEESIVIQSNSDLEFSRVD